MKQVSEVVCDQNECCKSLEKVHIKHSQNSALCQWYF